MAESRAEDLLRDFLESQWMDQIADYVQRGRKYALLNDDELIAKWFASVKAMADAPTELSWHDENNDAGAELALRKVEPPHDQAAPYWHRYMETSDAVIRELQRDPERLKDLKDSLAAELLAFEDARDRSN